MTRTRVKDGDESLEYKDDGEQDGKDTRKENNDRNAKKNLKFALPPTLTLNISRAMFFDANRAKRAPADSIAALLDSPVFNKDDRPEEEYGGIEDRICMAKVVG